jgi:Tfp pilus assembly protein PilO
MIREHLSEVEPRSLAMILMLVSFVFATAIALYMVKPQYQHFSESSNSFAMLNGQIDDQAQLQRAIDTERNKIREMQLKLHGEAGDMPVNEMEAYLVGRLQGLAWAAGIELAGVRPGQAKRIMEFEEVSFKVDVTGEYRDLYDWLNKIGDKLGFMLVSNYEISLAGKISNATPLKMNVTIVFYRAVDK